MEGPLRAIIGDWKALTLPFGGGPPPEKKKISNEGHISENFLLFFLPFLREGGWK
jgi:hypothetical protein